MVNRILVINLMYIGDLLFTTPLLRTLRTNFPEAELVVVADRKNSDVIRHNPHVSDIIAIDKKGYHNKLKNYIKLITNIRRRKFDLVINLHANERASAIAAFSNAKKIVGFAARGFGVFFDKAIHERTDIHQVDAYLETLQAAGIEEIDNHGLEMWVDEDSQRKADRIWQETFGNPPGHCEEERRSNLPPDTQIPIIGINTGGSWPTKHWTKNGFASLADRLLLKGFEVAFFGGPMDIEDVEQIQAMMTEATNPHLAIFTGKTTLLEMAALVKKCNLMVSGDSGPMHIAVSQKIPVVVPFGPSNPIRYAPYRQQDAIVITNKDCLACGKHSCEDHSCMKEISAELIYKRISSKLSSSKQGALSEGVIL